MKEVYPLDAQILQKYQAEGEESVNQILKEELHKFNRKIVVLDDDPTGIQTIHDVSVYTDWSLDSIRQGFEESASMFFILTNSRSFTSEHTKAVHTQIASTVAKVSKESGKPYILISRGDSTLRGHYPLETSVLRQETEQCTNTSFDGEIIVPFFKEGGRFTLNNIHYVQSGNELIPAGLTEFAKDKTFGYTASHLGEWCEEKTKGQYLASKCTYISLETLRAKDYAGITDQLNSVTDFNKVIVNAIDYIDISVFAIAYIRSVLSGKNFLFRSAAAITKVLGGIPDKPLLVKEELVSTKNPNGGIILVGSHVKKTTQQLEMLKQSEYPIEFIEFNQHLALQPDGLNQEQKRVTALAEFLIKSGKTVAVFTRRERFDLDSNDKEKQLILSVQISDAVTAVITHLTVQPSFIIAKGGITSSDVGTKALAVKRACVMGQIAYGVPVWMTGPESKFPGMPYIIFPGNVGATSTLLEIVETLLK